MCAGMVNGKKKHDLARQRKQELGHLASCDAAVPVPLMSEALLLNRSLHQLPQPQQQA
jgi:hypothetical protein